MHSDVAISHMSCYALIAMSLGVLRHVASAIFTEKEAIGEQPDRLLFHKQLNLS
jgi:hypothetical protein